MVQVVLTEKWLASRILTRWFSTTNSLANLDIDGGTDIGC